MRSVARPGAEPVIRTPSDEVLAARRSSDDDGRTDGREGEGDGLPVGGSDLARYV